MAKFEQDSIVDRASYQMMERMGTEEFRSNFDIMIRRRQPLLHVTTYDEPRLVKYVSLYGKARGSVVSTWDVYSGFKMIVCEPKEEAAKNPAKNDPKDITDAGSIPTKDPIGALDYIISKMAYWNNDSVKKQEDSKGIQFYIFVLFDYSVFVKDNPGVIRRLKKIANMPSLASTIMVGHCYDMPESLRQLVPNIDLPHPNEEEMKGYIGEMVNALKDKMQQANPKIKDFAKETQKVEEDLIGAVQGLTQMQAQASLKSSLVKNRAWDIKTILAEKRDIVKKGGLLEFCDTSITMDDVGGLSNLVDWLKKRHHCFSKDAAEYGIQTPRGLLMIGVPGGGKSLICKAVASLWGMPLLRMDFGKMFNSLVGQSEGNVRQAIMMAESVSPAILWIDEIEKAITGVQSSGKSDGGTTSRVLSTFLTWMQEKTSPVFVVATANAQEQIPSEFIRAGRFDEVFLVKLPSYYERTEIARVLLRRKGQPFDKFDLEQIASASDHFSGAEIEKAIDSAILECFIDNKRAVSTDDVIQALGSIKTLFTSREEEFEDMAELETRFLVANSPDPENIESPKKKRKYTKKSDGEAEDAVETPPIIDLD